MNNEIEIREIFKFDKESRIIEIMIQYLINR
jgi:hypothetical protein